MAVKKIVENSKKKISKGIKSKSGTNTSASNKNLLEAKKSNRGAKGYDDTELALRIYSAEIPKGLFKKQIAEFLGISEDTFYSLIKRSNVFSEAIKFYTGESNLEVLKSFKNLACGYSFVEQEKELRRDKKTGDYELVVTKEVKKHVPANASAGIFYLKNKMPEHFKDKIETVHSAGEGLENITFIIKGKEK